MPTAEAIAEKQPKFISPEKIFIAGNHGFCAGVDRSIAMAWVIHKSGIEKDPDTITISAHPNVHNDVVTEVLDKAGIPSIDHFSPDIVDQILAERLPHLPRKLARAKANIVFSAHGYPPEEIQAARELGFCVYDATCPLVTKVHNEAKLYVKKGYHVVYIGKPGHREAVGVQGEIPNDITIIYSIEEAANIRQLIPISADKFVCLTQTTLGEEDTQDIKTKLQEILPEILMVEDICYATTNRQRAVKDMIERGVQGVIAVGSKTSSNTTKLVAVAQRYGVPAQRVNFPSEIDPKLFVNTKILGITSGASVPDGQMQKVTDFIVRNAPTHPEVIHLLPVADEGGKEFKLPQDLRDLVEHYKQTGQMPDFAA